MSAPVTAEAAAALAATSTTDLLRNAYRLTHAIHEAGKTASLNRELSIPGREADDTAAGLRAQRDLIDAEIERRGRSDAAERQIDAARDVVAALTPTSRRSALRARYDTEKVLIRAKPIAALIHAVEGTS
jgi:hypothetical protein